MELPQLSDKILMAALEAVTVKMGQKIEKKKNRNAHINKHESLGVITEEYKELIDAVQSNDLIEVGNELADVAVACILGIASLMEAEERLKEAKKKLKETIEK